MRHLVLLASVYVLVALLVLPSSLVASDGPAPPGAAEAGETATVPAEPPAAAPAPSPAPETQQAPAPEPEPQTTPAPAPTEQQPAPAPTEQQPAPAPAGQEPAPSQAEPGAEQDLGDEREQLRPKSRRVVATAAASTSVTIRDFTFSPKSVTIDAGDTVTWTNEDDVEHSATAEDGSFDTGTFGNGRSRSHTFDTAGTFQYICTPHPFMKGTINVNAAGGGGSGSGDSGSGSGSSSDGSGSSSGSSSSSSESGSSTSGSGSSADSGPVLPDTGADAATVAILGLLMLGLGVAVQRRAGARQG